MAVRVELYAEIDGSTRAVKNALHSCEMHRARTQTELRYSLNCEGNVTVGADGSIHEKPTIC
jgi:hypothetical protein